MIIAKHFPALQILIPFGGAILAAFSFHRFTAWLIAVLTTFLNLGLAIYAAQYTMNSCSYYFGNWPAPIGIEYTIDVINQPIIIFVNAVLLFYLTCASQLTKLTVTDHIPDKTKHIFYSLLLFAHTGFIGMLSTNDLFNLYVFIEISSLATYVLMSQGKSPAALIGAFDYLIIGTIGATLILLGVGFLFAITGSLNTTDIATILGQQDLSRLTITAMVFFLTGAILKIAFFPMHFWMMRSYTNTAPIILTYLAAISSALGVYIILRFIYFSINIDTLSSILLLIIRPTSLATIVICTFLALKATNIKKVIIYSTASQIGYIFLLMTIMHGQQLLFQFLIVDAINKIALFTIIAHIQLHTNKLNYHDLPPIHASSLFKTLVAFCLIYSAGLPITSMFVVKLKILNLLINQNLVIELIIVLITFAISLVYHLKIVQAVFFGSTKRKAITINTKMHGLVVAVIFQVITLIYIDDLARLAGYTESFIVG